MKKGIIVLLIAVLVAGFAFADFSGSAKIGYDFNLSSKEHGLFNEQGMTYGFTFKFDSAEGGSKGEGDLYAEIAATAEFTLVADDEEVDSKKDEVILIPSVTLEITKANIIYKDVTIGILGPKGPFNYAASYYKNSVGKKAQYDFASAWEVTDPGFTVTYKDFTVAFAYRHYVTAAVPAGDITDYAFFWVSDDDYDAMSAAEKAHYTDSGLVAGAGKFYIVDNGSDALPAGERDSLYAGIQTPAFELADGLKLQSGVNFGLEKKKDDDASIKVSGGAKVTYKNEDAKVSASLAADVEFDKKGDADGKIPMDISAGATYDFVTADVYFGTQDKFDEGKNYLCAKVSAKKSFDAITVSASAEVRDMIKNDNPDYLFTANVNYKADSFAAYFGAEARLAYVGGEYKLAALKKDKWDYKGLGLKAGISTTTLIDNATVALDWTGSDFSKKNAQDELTTLGKIAASVTVEF